MSMEISRPISSSIVAYRMSMEVVQELVDDFLPSFRTMIKGELEMRGGSRLVQMLDRMEKLTRHLKNIECEKYGIPSHTIINSYLTLATICGVYYYIMKEELALANRKIKDFLSKTDLPEISREFIQEMEKLSHIQGTINSTRFSFFYPESLFVLDSLRLDSLGCVGILNNAIVCQELKMDMFDQYQKLVYDIPGDHEAVMRKPTLIDVIKDECNRSEGEMNTMAGEYERKRRVSHMHYFIQGLQTDVKEFDEQIDWESSDNVTKNLFPM
nr:putative P3 protein [Cytorhabdovirus sp.]